MDEFRKNSRREFSEVEEMYQLHEKPLMTNPYVVHCRFPSFGTPHTYSVHLNRSGRPLPAGVVSISTLMEMER
jgi:hypothetical protein